MTPIVFTLVAIACLVAMLVLGPDVIFGFTAAMVLGIIIGTYSSIFVSSSLLISLGVKSRAAPAQDQRNAGAERVAPRKP